MIDPNMFDRILSTLYGADEPKLAGQFKEYIAQQIEQKERKYTELEMEEYHTSRLGRVKADTEIIVNKNIELVKELKELKSAGGQDIITIMAKLNLLINITRTINNQTQIPLKGNNLLDQADCKNAVENGQLAAAAPIMYDLLKRLYKHIDHSHYPDLCNEIIDTLNKANPKKED
jgi:hypothetical protein